MSSEEKDSNKLKIDNKFFNKLNTFYKRKSRSIMPQKNKQNIKKNINNINNIQNDDYIISERDPPQNNVKQENITIHNNDNVNYNDNYNDNNNTNSNIKKNNYFEIYDNANYIYMNAKIDKKYNIYYIIVKNLINKHIIYDKISTLCSGTLFGILLGLIIATIFSK